MVTVASVLAPGQLVDELISPFGVTALPACIAVAVLKYRLYAIDRIMSRVISYAIITAILAGVFAGLVLLATEVLPFKTPGGGWGHLHAGRRGAVQPVATGAASGAWPSTGGSEDAGSGTTAEGGGGHLAGRGSAGDRGTPARSPRGSDRRGRPTALRAHPHLTHMALWLPDRGRPLENPKRQARVHLPTASPPSGPSPPPPLGLARHPPPRSRPARGAAPLAPPAPSRGAPVGRPSGVGGSPDHLRTVK